jgi:amino acid transporter
VLILIFVPDHHQSFSYVFTERFNNTGYFSGHSSGGGFWFFVIPFGFLLTQYTITGFDASAHLSEETSSASKAAAKGLWRSIFYSAVGGYILMLCFVFAVPNGADGKPDNLGVGGAISPIQYLFVHAMSENWAAFILFISAAAQLFCATSCMTSASRMLFAFSRDGAVPGSKRWSALSRNRVPANAVMLVAVLAALVTLPALIKVNQGTADAPFIIPVAFYAVTSIAALGLYLSFAIPIYYRWKHGDKFEVGSWNNGQKYKWMNLVAVAEIIIVSLYLMMPSLARGNPLHSGFSWKFVNYSPIVLLGSLLVLTIWWITSAKNWFTGPKHTIDQAVLEAFGEDKLTAD